MKTRHKDSAYNTARNLITEEMDETLEKHLLVRDVEVAPGIWVRVKIQLKSNKTWEWVSNKEE